MTLLSFSRKNRFAVPRTLHEKFQGECGLAGARHAFDEVQPVVDEAAMQDVVQPGDAGGGSRRRRGHSGFAVGREG